MTPTLRGPVSLAKDAYAHYKAHGKLLASIAVLPVLALFLAIFLSVLLVAGVAVTVHIVPAVILALILALGCIYIGVVSKIALILAISNPTAHPTLRTAFSAARPHFLSYALVSALVGLIVFVGFIFFVVPGIIFALLFAFASYVLLLEGKKGRHALSRSKELAKGHMLAILYRGLAFGLMYLAIYFIPAVVLQMLFGQSIADAIGMIIGLLTAPWAATYAYFMYTDLRAVKEGSLPPSPSPRLDASPA